MLSFLIALIKGVFDQVKARKDELAFNDRAEMNMKYANNKLFFGISNIWNCNILWAEVETDRMSIKPSQIEIIDDKCDKLLWYATENERLTQALEEKEKFISNLMGKNLQDKFD